MDDDIAQISEYKIPSLCNNENDETEISIEIDNFIIECIEKYNYMYFDNKTINFDDRIEYTYDQGDIMDLCISKESSIIGVILPEICCLESDNRIGVKTENGYIKFNDSCGRIFKLKVYDFNLKIIEEFFNSSYIMDVMKKNKNTFCKIYLAKDFPICFEFCDKRVFITPLD